MIADQQQAREQMRRDLYATIRRNLVRRKATLSRHEVIEILATVLIGQIELIRDDAQNEATK